MVHQPPEPLLSPGSSAPDFSLPDLQGMVHCLEEKRGQIVIINFWSADCPWSERVDAALIPLLSDWGEQVVLCTIASNANESLSLIRQVSFERKLPLVLHDAHQHVADLYGAQTTPHLFVIDVSGFLRYQGAYDDGSFRQRIPRQAYLSDAVEALLHGRMPVAAHSPPYGCTIVRHSS